MKKIWDRKSIKKKIVIESIMVFFIAITPFLHRIYDYLPDDNPEATVSFLGITIGSNGFNHVSAYVWFLTNKIIPLYLLLFWFFTSKNWWYHILLIPILLYAFQLFELLYSENDIIDTENIWWLLPVCIVVIPFVYLLRTKLYDKYVHGIDLDAMEAELRLLKQKQGVDTSTNATENKEVPAPTPSKPSRAYRSLSEKIEYGLSTHNIESKFKAFQTSLRSFLHL